MNSKAVSLVELSIALATLGVMALILLPAGSGIILKAKEIQNQRNLKTVAYACRQYYQKFNQWPASVIDMQPFFLSQSIESQDYELITGDNIIEVILGGKSVIVPKPQGVRSRLNLK